MNDIMYKINIKIISNKKQPKKPTFINTFAHAHCTVSQIFAFSPGPIAQSVASPTADRDVARLIPAPSHTLLEIDN